MSEDIFCCVIKCNQLIICSQFQLEATFRLLHIHSVILRHAVQLYNPYPSYHVDASEPRLKQFLVKLGQNLLDREEVDDVLDSQDEQKISDVSNVFLRRNIESPLNPYALLLFSSFGVNSTWAALLKTSEMLQPVLAQHSMQSFAPQSFATCSA